MADVNNSSSSLEVLTSGVMSSYKHGWRQMWKYFLELLLIAVISFIITNIFSWLTNWQAGWYNMAFQYNGYPSALPLVPSPSPIANFLTVIYAILIAGPIGYGMAYAFLKATRSEKVKVSDLFEPIHNYWNTVLANILVFVIIGIGFVLLVIPGIIFACKLAFTPYLVVDRKMDVIEAVKESWRMTNGHAWKVFFIILLGIPITLAGLLLLGVGIIISILWITLALASLYYAVSRSSEISSQPG